MEICRLVGWQNRLNNGSQDDRYAEFGGVVLRYYAVLLPIAVTACTPTEPPVCNAALMTETEYAAYNALPEGERPNHCAIQVIPDEIGQQVRFDVVDAS